ncbi:sugar ABC transporter permease [Vagococcus sp. BWB3-3]|uniref:Sugar ABC transporter permease n=1 Tax=Vagococcus allomyrinae TaxID=2794353 RepID=A0A940PA20_9ENTE|nr:sugar ABC transporter permease [Vagococcus allomyrinae]MBP1040900.1 sugar ABC transporter permease [Vagococcus allomyrinae]
MDRKQRTNAHGLGFVLPALLIITIFSFVPMIQSFFLSFQTGKGVVTEFGGLANYRRLFQDPVFIQAVKNTLLFLVIQVPIMTVLALIIAAILNDKKLKFRGFFRVCIFLPCVTSLVSYSVLFKSLFSSSGLINDILLKLQLIDLPIEWLTDPFWAKVTIIIALTWRWTGYDMIFYLAAMQNIDESVYEAARLDGANGFKQFFSITVPMLKPIILLTTIMSTNGTLQLFDEVMNLTNGGPNNATITISKYIYDLSFKFTPNFGYAATVSYAIVVFVAVLTFIQFRVTNRKEG